MGAYAFAPLHGYTQNLAGSTFPHTDTPKTRPVLHPNRRRRTFRGVCNTPLHGYVQNLAGFIFPHTNTPKTHPISLFPIGMPQNPPGFTPKPSVQDISGRMLLRPYTDTCKTHPVLYPNLRRGVLGGRMQYAPTRVHAKFGRFHISAPEYVKNTPDFIHPNRDTPKTRPILDPNLRRRTFRGVCFCAPTRVRAKFSGF